MIVKLQRPLLPLDSWIIVQDKGAVAMNFRVPRSMLPAHAQRVMDVNYVAFFFANSKGETHVDLKRQAPDQGW